MVEALRAGDAKAAEDVMRAHLEIDPIKDIMSAGAGATTEGGHAGDRPKRVTP